MHGEIAVNSGQVWDDRIIFQFWLAIHKEHFSETLKSKETSEDEKVLLRKAIGILKDIPSKNTAVARVQSAVKKSAEKGANYWAYYGDEYADLLRSVFERAAR